MTAAPQERAVARFEAPADPSDLSREAYRRGWTDGLPVIAPTPGCVDTMIAASGRDALDALAVLAPRRGIATVEAVAVNAVMAGCEPRHMPVLCAAVEATGTEAFNLAAVNATTHPVALLILVSEPAARAADIHAGSGAFGPGFAANICIGRALRLVQFNIAGARPGDGDMATLGSPAKLAYCFAERTDVSPFGAYHDTLGLEAGAHAVTVFPAECPINIQDHSSSNAEDLMRTIAGSMGYAGNNNIVAPHKGRPVLVLGIEHARVIADSGWSRRDVQQFVVDHARFDASRLGPEFIDAIRPLRKPLPNRLPIALDPEQVQVLVAGGPGKHSMFIPTFAGTREATISWQGGRP